MPSYPATYNGKRPARKAYATRDAAHRSTPYSRRNASAYTARSRRRRPVARLAVGIVCFILLALLIAKVIAPLTSDAGWTSIAATPLDAISSQASENPRSTPQSEWTRGCTPYLYQKDPQWASREYADGTIGTHGCGPTALTMAYIRLTGKTDVDPAKMAQFAERCGFIDNGLTSWLLMSQGAEMLGFPAEWCLPARRP